MIRFASYGDAIVPGKHRRAHISIHCHTLHPHFVSFTTFISSIPSQPLRLVPQPRTRLLAAHRTCIPLRSNILYLGFKSSRAEEKGEIAEIVASLITERKAVRAGVMIVACRVRALRGSSRLLVSFRTTFRFVYSRSKLEGAVVPAGLKPVVEAELEGAWTRVLTFPTTGRMTLMYRTSAPRVAGSMTGVSRADEDGKVCTHAR